MVLGGMKLRGRKLSLAAACALLLVPAAARASTINVTTTTDTVVDDGLCSLREAVMSADADNAGTNGAGGCVAGSGNDTISVPAGSYQLTRSGPAGADSAFGDLDVVTPMTINGVGAGSTTIDAGGLDRALNSTSTLTVQNLTITGGRPHTAAGAEDGGAIRATGAGALFVAGVTFIDNRAQDGNAGASALGATHTAATGGAGATGGRGGAIYSTVGLTVAGSRFENNRSGAGGTGGGGQGGGGGLDQTTANGGSGTGGTGGTGGKGGAIYAAQGAVVTGSVFVQNVAAPGGAGGAGTGGAGGGWDEGDVNHVLEGEGNGGFAAGGAGGIGGEAALYVAAGSSQVSTSTFSADTTGAGGAGGAAKGGSTSTLGPMFGTPGTGGSGTGGAGGHAGDGGAIVTDGAARPISLSASTFSQNGAASGGTGGAGVGGDGFGAGAGGGGAGGYGGFGGAVEIGAGGTLVNDTFDANAAGAGGSGAAGTKGSGNDQGGTGNGAGGVGGGGGAVVTAVGGATTITHSTFLGNTYGAGVVGSGAPGGDGSVVDRADGSVALGANLFTGVQPSSCQSESSPGQITDLGHNVRTAKVDGSCPSTVGTNTLGPLQDNGGPVPTLALVAGDAGVDEVPAAGCPSTDARGAPRPFGAGCDAGAYELTPPSASTGLARAITSTGATLVGTVNAHGPAGTVRFEYGPTESYGSTTASQQLGSGFGNNDVTAAIGGLHDGAVVHYRVDVTTADGTATGSDATFTAGQPGSASGGGTGTRSSSPDRTAPRLTRVGLSAKRFAVSAKPTAKSARRTRRVPHGTTIRLTLSEQATVRFTITHKVTRTCTVRKGRKKVRQRCTKTVTAGTLTRRGLRTGARGVPFSGRIGRTALKPGAYRLTIIGTDAAGNRSKPSTLALTIVRG
jgi:CSLREA domain-containing protein